MITLSHHRESDNNLIIVGILLVISPLLALPFIISLINQERKGATYLMAIFMGIFAFLFPPMGDLYKHNMIYFYFAGEQGSFLEWLKMNIKTDYVIWGASYFLSKFHIPFEYIRLIITLSEFSILGWIYEKYVLSKPLAHKTKMRIYALLCIGFIPLYQILGMRHGFAICLFLFAILKLYEENKKVISILFLVIGACVHFHFVPLAIIALINYYCPLIRSNKVFYPLFIIGLVFGSILTPIIIRFFYGSFSKSEGYMDFNKEYGGGMTFSGNAGIGMLITRLWYFPMLFIFLNKKKRTNEKLESLVYLFAVMVVLMWPFHTFSERSGKVLGTLLCVYYALYPAAMKMIKSIYAVTLFILIFMQIYGLRLLMFYTDNNLKDIWKPIPVCLKDNYSVRWLNTNIDSDGSLISVGEHWSL